MKIGIDFSRDVYATKENINKLLSSGVVYEEDEFTDYLCYDYFIDVDTLEEFDEVLSKIEEVFNLNVGLFISSDRLSIFLEFDVK